MSVVSVEKTGQVARVTINNPPVNALGHAVRQGLWDVVESTEADPSVKVVVVACAGRTFVAGADIREFGQPPKEPHLPDLLARIEGASKPWVAAIHGTALGGGLELALACHYRIATPDAKMGLPEVNLGLIPGAGGTIRLPRLIGARAALQIITSGKPVGAVDAVQSGLIDRVAKGSLPEAVAAYADEVAGRELPRPVSSRTPEGPAPDWDSVVAEAAKKARGAIATVEAAEAVRDGLTLPAAEAFGRERERFLRLRDGEQSKALRHIFFAERAAAKPPGNSDTAPRPTDRIGLVGGGTMGAGIATAALLAGRQVIIAERDEAACNKGLETVCSHLAGSLKRGLIDQATHDGMLSRLSGTTSYRDFADCDLVIEAVFEDMAVKKAVFAELDSATRENAVLATNTSYLDVNEIAAAVRDPSRVVGLHFFSPAHVMKLLEIVQTDSVAPDVIVTAFALARALGKIAVLAGVCDGFIANRIMSSYRNDCDFMLEEGALPGEIDKAMTDFGFPMGIFAMQDLAGLDIGWAARKRRAATRDPNAPYVAIADRLCEAGRFGRKTGAGWYRYADGKAEPDPEVERIILEESQRKGITRRKFTQAEIMERILTVMQAEGNRVLAEGIARSADDIDVVMVNGYGFPRWRGGPMHMASTANGTSN